MTPRPGISHVWLDGVRKAGLDKSVPQIGAPAAWAKGYDGMGVKVAVLDTGLDSSRPDLEGQVLATKNQKLPTRTYHLSTGGGAEWYFDFQQFSAKKDADGVLIVEAESTSGDYLKLFGGKTYRKSFDTAVFAPRVVPGLSGVFHGPDGSYGQLPLFRRPAQRGGAPP